ncbi:hypothetical protein [Spiroplasma endosymbiont of Polydrusus formosus]|uniref:hypothetical protein n=1 Tax=Spiroplasma endosymbiont of Polydrusus formosus TaxID=3139326 RepID=UPI0035B525EC
MKKNTNSNLTVQNDKIWARIKKSVFHKELYNQSLITFKIATSAIFLAVAVGLSLLEVFNVPTPWGATFRLRFFDTLVIIYSISIVGLGFALLEGVSLPWIHNLIDGYHTWIEMAFFMISNILVVFITWFVYYILFNAYAKITVPENVTDHNIHEYHHVKKAHNHHHKISNINFVKKFLAFIIIIPICALIEAISFIIIVVKILVNIGNTDVGQYHGHDIDGMASIFESWQHTLIFIGIFFGIFTGKYIVNTTLFLLLERRTRQLADRYGIYV